MNRNIDYLSSKNHSSKTNSNHRVFGRELKNSNTNIQKNHQKSNSNKEINKSSNTLKQKKINQKKSTLSLSRNYSSNTLLPSISEIDESGTIQSQQKENKINSQILKKQKVTINPQLVPEYSDEILSYLLENELINVPDYSKLFEKQEKINERTRGILIDWICYVHHKFSLLPETLFLSLNIIDQYTTLAYIDISQYQLVAIAAMLIASKYEEYYAPEIKDFIVVTKGLFSKDQIIKMEYSILCKLKFDILFTSSYKFLEYFYIICSENENKKLFHLAQYILEISQMDVSVMKYKQSMRAGSALYMARKILKEEIGIDNDIWNLELKFRTGLNETDLKPCVRVMIIFLQIVLKNKSNSFRDKFNTLEFSRVGTIFTQKTN